MLLGQDLPNPATSTSTFCQLGGIETSFTISTDSVVLPVLSQGLIRRGFSYADADYMIEHGEPLGYGYGIGMEALFFEFTSQEPIDTQFVAAKWSSQRFYRLEFFDEKNQLILRLKGNHSILNLVYSNAAFTTYSFVFRAVPAIVLNHTKRIDIAYYYSSRW